MKMIKILFYSSLILIVGVTSSTSNLVVIPYHKETKIAESFLTVRSRVLLEDSINTKVASRREKENDISSEVPSNNTFSGDFTIVKANRCPSALAICTDNDPQTFQNGSVVSLLDDDPISLYIDYTGNFTKVVLHYNDGVSTIKQREFLPPYALGGNDRFENFAPVAYLQTPGVKVITVRGFVGWDIVAKTTISFTITDDRPSTPSASPISSSSKECFRTNSQLHIAILAYLDCIPYEENSKALVRARYGEAIGSWCVDYIEDFSSLFSSSFCIEMGNFNEDISGWNTSAAQNMSHMFEYYYGTFNQSLNNWDVSRVIDMSAMFIGQRNFDQDLNNWDVSKVVHMTEMFALTPFNRDISMWDVRSVEKMEGVFFMNEFFNQDLSKWNVSSVTDMSRIFQSTNQFKKNLCAWGKLLQKDTVIDYMFMESSCPSLSEPDLSRTPPGPFCFDCFLE